MMTFVGRTATVRTRKTESAFYVLAQTDTSMRLVPAATSADGFSNGKVVHSILSQACCPDAQSLFLAMHNAAIVVHIPIPLNV